MNEPTFKTWMILYKEMGEETVEGLKLEQAVDLALSQRNNAYREIEFIRAKNKELVAALVGLVEPCRNLSRGADDVVWKHFHDNLVIAYELIKDKEDKQPYTSYAPAIPEGFTLWDGTTSPLDINTIVDVFLRDGSTTVGIKAGNLAWYSRSMRPNGAIIAYRVHGPIDKPLETETGSPDLKDELPMIVSLLQGAFNQDQRVEYAKHLTDTFAIREEIVNESNNH